MLKKLTAAGFLAATTTGVMLSGGPANADLLSAHRAAVSASHPGAECYYGQPVYYQPAWCTEAPPVAITPPVTIAPPVPVYPGYPGYHYGWDRWHHRHYWPGRVYFRR